MFEPEEQQIEICLLKSNLEEIEHELAVQHTTVPALDAENEQKYREKMSALKAVVTLNTEFERLKLENVKLTAIRAQLKKQSDEKSEELETACEDRDQLTQCLKQKQEEIDTVIGKYEDSLQEKAERFRKSFRYYEEEDVNKEIEMVNSVIAELKERLNQKQRKVDGLRAQMDAIQPDAPENLLEQVGKQELDGKLKSLAEMQKSLEEKLKAIKK